jgi:nucleotide-binding universal stress UspA family protein
VRLDACSAAVDGLVKMSFLLSPGWAKPSMERILLPLQGFPAEINATNLAFYIAESSGASITILHCKEEEEDSHAFWLDRLIGHARSLSMLLGVRFTFTEVEHVHAPDAILRVSRKEPVNLIVMTAARSPAYKQLLGSTSRRVARKSKVPTVVVASWLEDFEPHQEPVIRKILLPIGDVKEDMAALLLAAVLKRSSAAQAAELIALHVTLLPAVVPITATDLPEIQEEHAAFHKDLERFMQETGLKMTPKHVAARKIGQATIELAAQEDVDLIILGARRKPRRFRRIFGRVSFKIASRAKAAVVLIFGR